MKIELDLDEHDAKELIRYLEGDHHMGVYDRSKIVTQLRKQLPPEEPTGLGAVVEDDKGVRWVRIGELGRAGMDDWKYAGTIRPQIDTRNDWRTWAEFNAVRVLSEGVTL